MPLALLIVLVVVLAGCGGGDEGTADGRTAPAPPAEPDPAPTETADTSTSPGTVPTITQNDGNRTVAIAVGGEARLQLGGGLAWDQPLVRGDAGAVELSPVEYFADPGFAEWAIRGVAPGEAVVSSSGSPDGGGRPQRFEVTIRVEG